MPSKELPIYVVVASDDMHDSDRDFRPMPLRKPNPIVFETNVEGATLEEAQKRAAQLERGYGACRVGRVIFEDHPAFKED